MTKEKSFITLTPDIYRSNTCRSNVCRSNGFVPKDRERDFLKFKDLWPDKVFSEKVILKCNFSTKTADQFIKRFTAVTNTAAL